MALWSLPVEALSATLGLPRALGYWPLTIGATLGLPRTLGYWPLIIGTGSVDEEPEPQTMFLKVLGFLSDPKGSAGLGTFSAFSPQLNG